MGVVPLFRTIDSLRPVSELIGFYLMLESFLVIPKLAHKGIIRVYLHRPTHTIGL